MKIYMCDLCKINKDDYCNICGEKIESEIKYIDGKTHCKNCYYEELGKVVEKYPIGRFKL